MARSLVVDIAVGVALGIVSGVAMLTLIAYLVVRSTVDDARALAAFNAGLRMGSVVGAPVVQGSLPAPATKLPEAPACRLGEVPGQVNGEAVCVGRSSGIVRRLSSG